MKKWTSDDYTYAMDSDVISHGYEIDLQTEKHQNYDISEVSLSYTEKKYPYELQHLPVNNLQSCKLHIILIRIFL